MSSGPHTKFMNAGMDRAPGPLGEPDSHRHWHGAGSVPSAQCFHVLDVHSKPIKVCRAVLSLWWGLWPGH